MSSEKLWDGRFTVPVKDIVEKFTESLNVDGELFQVDIEGSKAHCVMLYNVGIVNMDETTRMCDALDEIGWEIQERGIPCSSTDEDIHMYIERKLTEKIGAPGGKIHTARSRNDQIALDERLYLKRKTEEVCVDIRKVQSALLFLAKKYKDVIMPGFTHLQHSQPVYFSHYVLSYAFMLERDYRRFVNCLDSLNWMPLGSGAMAGVPYPIDRNYVAARLEFSRVSPNSLDATSDRDYIVEFLSCISIVMMHLSRFAEDIIIFTSQEFGFCELPEEFCTGSSIMPQKKNPDVLELIRGKAGSCYGNLVSLLVTMKGIPLAYNRDMQEDKKPLFASLTVLTEVLGIFTELIKSIRLNPSKLNTALDMGFMGATDLADYLAKKGVPFREAHRIVGKIVSYCITKNISFSEISLEQLKSFSQVFEADVFDALVPSHMVNARNHAGGTSQKAVDLQIKQLAALLKKVLETH